MKIVIPGKPIGQARPRFARRGKFVKVYNPQETEAGKALLLAMNQITKKYTGPVVVSMLFEFQRPKSHFGTGRNAGRLKESASHYHTIKPDTSNCVKFIEDILNGVAWDDDKQIFELRAKKSWTIDGAKTTIYIV